jgi:hypothetical protein
LRKAHQAGETIFGHFRQYSTEGERHMTNITTQHREAFEALVSGQYNNFALFSCFVDGQPAAAIVAVNRDGEEYTLSPLFVSVTDAMTVTDHDGTAA